MEDKISSTYNKTNVEQENHLDLTVIKTEHMLVTNSYVKFLTSISVRIVEKYTNDVEREKRKFRAVRKEFLNYLFQHRRFFRLKKIQVLSKHDASTLYTLILDSSDKLEDFLSVDDIFEFYLKIVAYEDLSKFNYIFENVEKEVIVKTIKVVQKKSVISNEDIGLFLENHYLVDKNDLRTKCSNYKELTSYIDSRFESYCNGTISSEHINNMSFQFQGPIKDFEDEKSCVVCLEDYEEDQEVCRLPCNHFCCRSCTEQMFAIPEDGSKANFQCPVCRDDCT